LEPGQDVGLIVNQQYGIGHGVSFMQLYRAADATLRGAR
jgi:hypothetical protein